MTAAAVTADVSRIAVATIATDTGTWGNDGGGGGVADEPDIVYQGSTAQSRKISTSVIGRDYTHGSGTDMTAAATAHWIAKVNATNSTALLSRSSPALHVKIGSSSANYDTFYIFGNDNYPARGGWQILPITPNVSGYRDATTATAPTRSSILYWSLLGDFSATAKAENVVIDAIDLGRGLGVVSGTTPDPAATFDSFVTADEGTSGNRWGFVYTEGPVLYVTGLLAIGQTGDTQTSTLTTFTDSGVTVVWNNGYAATGFHKLLLDIATTSTAISLTNCSLGSQGEENNTADRGYTTTEDTRTVLEVTGTAGTVTFDGCVIDNFASLTLNSDCTFTNCTITDSGQITADGTTLTNTSVSGYTGAADTSAIVWNNTADPGGEMDGMTITKHASTAHHAIEFGTSSPTSINLSDMDFNDFNASDAQNDSTFYVARTSGTVTINLSNVTGNVSYKSAGATVVVQQAVTHTLTNLQSGSEVTYVDRVLGTELFHVETTGGSTSYPYNFTGTVPVDILVMNLAYEPIALEVDLGGSDQTLPVSQVEDRVFSNP